MKKVIIKFTVNGPVDKKDIAGALFKGSKDVTNKIDIEGLIKNKKTSKFKISLKKSKQTTGKVEFLSKLNDEDLAFLISVIEHIKKVGKFDANFRLLRITRNNNYNLEDSIEKRAKEILRLMNEPQLREYSKVIKLDDFILHKSALNSKEVIVVLNKELFLNLINEGFNNVLLLKLNNNSDKEVKEKLKSLRFLLNNKKLILFISNNQFDKFKFKSFFDYIVVFENSLLTKREIKHLLSKKIPINALKKALIKSLKVAEKEEESLKRFITN